MRKSARLALVLALAAGGALAADDAGTRYAHLLADAETIAAHNQLVERQLGSQQARLEAIQRQLEGLDVTSAEFGPLLARMFAELEQFVVSDLPFVDPVADRNARMEKLRELVGTEGKPVAEKYRKVMEAYQIEMEYGRSLDSYKAALADGRDAEFVRVGRISLMYRTLDGEEVGYWDAAQKQWVVDNDYMAAVLEALRVAKKELAPDLIEIPVPAPQEVRS